MIMMGGVMIMMGGLGMPVFIPRLPPQRRLWPRGSNPLDITEGDFLYREQAEHYAAKFGTDVVTRITLVTTDGADEAGYYARCAAHFATIYLRMEGSWANVRGSVLEKSNRV